MQWPQTPRRIGIRARAAATVAGCLAFGSLGLLEAQDAAEQLAQPLSAGLTGLSLPDLRRGRDTLMSIRDFDAALNPAKTIIDAQQVQRDPFYAADLAALGIIEGELRQTDEATAHLLEAIELVETAEGTYSPMLVDYYRGLGRTYIRGAQYPEAIATLEQAQHISQRNQGLFNVEQSALLDDITTAYLGLGDTIEARNTQLARLDNAVRRFGPTDPRVIPFRYVLANYYARSRLPESAREQYEEVLKSQESRLGATAPELLAPLRELVGIDLLISQGADPTNRDRLASLLEQNLDIDPTEQGLSLALLGDWSIVKGDAATAQGYYQQAWSSLSSAPSFDVTSHFSKPVMLDFVAPLSAVDRAERERPYSWGEIVLEFNVSAAGLPTDVRVLTRNESTTRLMAPYSRRMRETHFRPRLVDGTPVATTNVRSTHYFRYYVREEK